MRFLRLNKFDVLDKKNCAHPPPARVQVRIDFSQSLILCFYYISLHALIQQSVLRVALLKAQVSLQLGNVSSSDNGVSLSIMYSYTYIAYAFFWRASFKILNAYLMIAKCFCTYSEHITYIWALISKAILRDVLAGTVTIFHTDFLEIQNELVYLKKETKTRNVCRDGFLFNS